MMNKKTIFVSIFILLILFIISIWGCAPSRSLEVPLTELEIVIENQPAESIPEEINKPEKAPEAEHTVSILERTKENLRARGIDCTFENEHTTKNSLAIDPVNTNILYVGIEGKGIYKSSDGGKSWKTMLSLERLP